MLLLCGEDPLGLLRRDREPCSMRKARSFSVINAVSSSTILGLCVSRPNAPPIIPTAVDWTMVCFISLKNLPAPRLRVGEVTGAAGGWYGAVIPGGVCWGFTPPNWFSCPGMGMTCAWPGGGIGTGIGTGTLFFMRYHVSSASRFCAVRNTRSSFE